MKRMNRFIDGTRRIRSLITVCIFSLLFLFGLFPQIGKAEENPFVKSETNLPGDKLSPQAQSYKVTGVVTDANTNETLPGVNVLVKGTNTGVLTDLEGRYAIEVPSAESELQFSFVGYVTETLAANGQSTLDVALVPDITALEEVVVVGYGISKKATVTGSVASMDGEKLKSAPAINFSNALAGRLPGLVVVNQSGEPGYDGSILRIRGSNTLGDNSPLIVVDGVPNRGLDRLNSSDIESITVLKDASAAIYGSQAANGVILITTKRGKEGKPLITASFNQGWSRPTVLPDMADAATYAQVQNEVNISRGNDPSYSDEDIELFRNGTDPWGHPNTDWFDEVYKPFSAQNNTNLSISGGSETMKYFVSLGYKYQDGNYRNSATNYKQFDFRSNLDGKISNYITMSLDVSGRQENRSFPSKDAGTIYNATLRSFPTLPAFWPNGMPGPDIERGENPAVMATNATGFQNEKAYILNSLGKLKVSIPWVNGLSFSGNASIDKTINSTKLWQTPWDLYTWDGSTLDENGVPELVRGSRGFPEPRLTQGMSDGHQLTLYGLGEYVKTFSEKHNFKLLAGIERITGENVNFQAYRRFYISEVTKELFAGGDLEKDNTGSSSETARLNYFGRVNYDYNQKYMVEFVWRYDGSYMFPEDSRFGFFPGISAGWRISEEGFWKQLVPFVGYMKIRGSWGQTGNDRIEEYQYLASYGFGTTYNFDYDVETKTLSELRTPNPNVTWEVANQTNVGFDTRFWQDRFHLSFDYFYNLRTNILWWRNASVPATAGISLPRENIGKVKNQGFEVDFGFNSQAGDLKFGVSANVAYQKNEIVFWDETPGIPEYQKSTGHPMNSKLLYQAIGIFNDEQDVNNHPHWEGAQPGDIIFKDVNKDEQINSLDMVRYDKSDLPTWTGGINIDLSYKNVYARIFLQGAAGAVAFHSTSSGLFGNFRQDDIDGRWTPENTGADKPRPWNNVDEYWYTWDPNNTYFVRNSDYLRLKNLEIGYDLPSRITQVMKIQGLRLYFTGSNLITLTGMVDYDPEAPSTTYFYPPLKVINFGVTLTF